MREGQRQVNERGVQQVIGRDRSCWMRERQKQVDREGQQLVDEEGIELIGKERGLSVREGQKFVDEEGIEVGEWRGIVGDREGQKFVNEGEIEFHLFTTVNYNLQLYLAPVIFILLQKLQKGTSLKISQSISRKTVSIVNIREFT